MNQPELQKYLTDIKHVPEIRRRSRRVVDTLSTPDQLIKCIDEEPVAHGYWRDVYKDKDGNILDITPWTHNLVVNIFANLVAALCMGNSAGAIGTTYAGVQYMALGTNVVFGGTPAGETTVEQAGDIGLVSEQYRQIIGNAYFVNSGGAALTPPATSPNLAISTTFPVGVANFALAEFGLFGGNATSTVNSGFMIDRVTHAVINKPSGSGDFELTRIVTLIF